MKLRIRFALSILLLASPASAEGVRVVRHGGGLDFPGIQAAVDAAVDGEVVLVAAGNYAPFTIDGKGVSVIGVPGALPQVDGTIEVRNLPSGSTVVLADLRCVGPQAYPLSGPALRLVSNAGDVRAQDCLFQGGLGVFEDYDQCFEPGHGGHGVELTASMRTAFVGCELRGGKGGFSNNLGFYECTGGNGGQGVSAASSPVALYDCTVLGGAGGENGTFGGDGGIGFDAQGLGFFASGSSIQGGRGGLAWDFIAAYPGDGGDGVAISGTTAFVLDSTILGGAAGDSIIPPTEPGEPGEPVSGDGTVNTLAGEARRVSASALQADAELLDVHFEGVPGDRAYLVRSQTTSFAFAPTQSGVWLVSRPAMLAAVPLGVVPASGVLDVTVKTRDLPNGSGAARDFFQGLAFDAAGATILAGALHLAVLDRASTPDCNANGSVDWLDVIEGTVPDCQPDLLPDGCQLATDDCNFNGVPDLCDVEEGTSQDQNSNGIPDECEGLNHVWHVDDSASPGGDGSAAFPFQTLAEGIAISLPGDTVLVANGLYVGPMNRGLSFTGRDIRLVSENGPLACVIDCEWETRFFDFIDGETLESRIEGFTIRRGRALRGGAINIFQSNTVIENCVFEDCQVFNNSGLGGAVYMNASATVVRNSTFQRNRALGSLASGGAIYAANGRPRIERCALIDNESTSVGGGLYFQPNAGAAPYLVSQCVFLDNVSGSSGGGVHTNIAQHDLVFANCLFAGNRAVHGGAISGIGNLFLLDCTLVHNVATQAGGAVRRTGGLENFFANCVLWDNASPNGPELAIDGASTVLTVTYCDVNGGQGSASISGGATLTWQAGNFDLDPAFVDPDGSDGDPLTTEDNDYRLGAGSPCIDAGDDPRIVPDLYDLDMDGNTGEAVPFDLVDAPRQTNDPAVPDTGNGTAPIVDLGAYERQP